LVICVALIPDPVTAQSALSSNDYLFNDTQFHLTNEMK